MPTVRNKALRQARYMEEALTVLRGKTTRAAVGRRRQDSTPDIQRRVALLHDWYEECPIRKRRGARNLSQAMLAAIVGAGERTIIRWERGTRPNPIHLAALREHLGEDLAKELREWRRAVPR